MLPGLSWAAPKLSGLEAACAEQGRAGQSRRDKGLQKCGCTSPARFSVRGGGRGRSDDVPQRRLELGLVWPSPGTSCE